MYISGFLNDFLLIDFKVLDNLLRKGCDGFVLDKAEMFPAEINPPEAYDGNRYSEVLQLFTTYLGLLCKHFDSRNNENGNSNLIFRFQCSLRKLYFCVFPNFNLFLSI